MKKLNRGQKGLTIIELLIAIAITSVITGGIATIVYQIYTGSARSSNHMVAVRQVQEAGYWVSQYAYTSQNTTINGTSGFPLTLKWIDFNENKYQKIEFILNSSSGGLRGSYYVNDVLNSTRTDKLPVFQFINWNLTTCQVSGGSDFSLPVNGDKFVITGGVTSDSGRITVTNGTISVTPAGGATATYNSTTKAWTWNTTAAGSNITVARNSTNTAVIGSWTSENKAAAAAITQGTTAALSSARGLVLNLTAIVGTGRNEASETRIYKVIPKSVS